MGLLVEAKELDRTAIWQTCFVYLRECRKRQAKSYGIPVLL